METILVLRLKQQQVAQLMAHCTEYRAYLWQHLLPSPERNQALRVIQALQGRLLTASQEPKQEEIVLPLSAEERTILHHLFHVMTKHWKTEPISEKHMHRYIELVV